MIFLLLVEMWSCFITIIHHFIFVLFTYAFILFVFTIIITIIDNINITIFSSALVRCCMFSIKATVLFRLMHLLCLYNTICHILLLLLFPSALSRRNVTFSSCTCLTCAWLCWLRNKMKQLWHKRINVIICVGLLTHFSCCSVLRCWLWHSNRLPFSSSCCNRSSNNSWIYILHMYLFRVSTVFRWWVSRNKRFYRHDIFLLLLMHFIHPTLFDAFNTIAIPYYHYTIISNSISAFILFV